MNELYDFELEKYHFDRNKLFKRLFQIANAKNIINLIEQKSINKGAFLVKENQHVTGFYFILEGKIKVFNSGANNKIQILKLASKGDIVGLSGFNSSSYWASAIAEQNVEAYFITPKNLEILLGLYNDFALLLIKALAFKARNYEIRQKHLSLFPATERIIDSLLLIASKFGMKNSNGVFIEHCTSRKDISSFAGVSEANTIRTLRKLQDKEYITIASKLITIINKEALINQLKKYCCPNNLTSTLNTCYVNSFY